MTDAIHDCGHPRRPVPVRRRGEQLVVDIHCHLHVAAAEGLIRAQVSDPPDPLAFTSPESKAVNAKLFASIAPKLGGADERIRDMDAWGWTCRRSARRRGNNITSRRPNSGARRRGR